MKKLPGLLVTFEGTEGAGKSTLIQLLLQAFHPRSSVILTREPGGTPVSEKIRKILLHDDMNPWTEVFLYEASRAEHVHRKILPALQKGKIVFCDRFTDSSLAYQAHARGLPWNTIHQLNETAIQGVHPHLVVWMDIQPERGLRRSQDINRFENEGVEFQKKVRRGFLKAKSLAPKRWYQLKVENKTPEELRDEVLQVLLRRFKTNRHIKKLKMGAGHARRKKRK